MLFDEFGQFFVMFCSWKSIFVVTFFIFWNIFAHNFLVSHHMDLKFGREIRCNGYLKIISKNFNISYHFGFFRPKMTENSKTAYRRPLPKWPMEPIWNFQIFLCNLLLYTNISYCAKFQPNWNAVVFILWQFTVSAVLHFERLGRNTQPPRLS